ncbi:DedA family protein [Pseudorhodoplanes sp.]|uniref:DedA family protein n=1 Tax=Pseudorhodoplanes sp. TaxID=1934341 RepID=UPI00391DB85F
MQEYSQIVIEFVRQNHWWAFPIVFLLAFGESLAFLSLVIPAWALLVGIGALINASGLSFWPIWLAAAAGAAAGDWVSYSIGFYFKHRIAHIWPFSRHPDMMPRGHAFMEKWGILGIFIGRFFGPLRATVPLVAGILEMHYWKFQFANVTSAMVWAYVLLAFGDFGMGIAKWLGLATWFH